MLLSDPETIRYINRNFVAVWESVRPVPKVTIDFGDGRKIERTLQGNTVMYVCLPDGRVLDAFPGVYMPAHFQMETEKTLAFVRSLNETPAPEAALLEWHKKQIVLALQGERMRITYSKMFVESPLLKALGVRTRLEPMTGSVAPAAKPASAEQPGFGQATPVTNPPLAERSASVPTAPVEKPAFPTDLKAAFRALAAVTEDMSKKPATVEQLRAEYDKMPVQNRPTPEQIGQRAVEMDSQNNLRIVRPAIHLLFASYEHLPLPPDCRDVIYKQLLHIPIDDPYLGLADALVPGTPR